MISTAALLYLQSCGNPVENSKYIPKNASFVLCFNLAKFSRKASDWKLLLNNDLPFFNFKKTEVFDRQLKNSGIDFQSTAYFFSNVYVEKESVYYALTLRLNSESKFDAFLRNAFAQVPEIKSHSGLRYAILGNKSIIGWVNKVAILINREVKTDEKNLRELLLRLRDLPEDQSLKVNNKEFQRLRLSEYDIASWVNLESYEWLVKKSIRKSLLPIVINLQNNYLTAVTKFEKGKISIDTKLYNLNGSLKEYQRIVKGDISQDLISQLPLFTPIALVGLGLDMKGIKNLVDNVMLQYIEDQSLLFTGSTPDQIMEMLTGDVLAVLKDIKTDSSRKPRYEYLLSLGIKKKNTLRKIFQRFQEEGFLVKQDSSYYAPSHQMYFIEQGNILFITSSSEMRSEVFRMKNKENDLGLTKLAPESFFVAYANVEKETRLKLPEELFSGDKIFEGVTKFTDTPFESFSVNTMPMKDTVSRTRLVLTLKDKEENSLKMLVNTLKVQTLKKQAQ